MKNRLEFNLFGVVSGKAHGALAIGAAVFMALAVAAMRFWH
jgi:hypothetical protein